MELMYRADLHCHSTCSDGTLSPEELLAEAKRKELSALSITDHDTVEAYTEETFRVAEKLGIRLFPGVEFSSRHENYPIHILGYAFDRTPALQDFCAQHQKRRRERNRAILRKLQEQKILIEEEELKRFGRECSIGRPHIAQLMLEQGVVSTIQEAFDLYIGEGKSCFEPGTSFTPEETLEVIHAASGKAFIAHPHLIQKQKVLDAILEMDFDGIECYYGLFHHGQEKKWLKIAKKKGWLISGGSDFHGSVKPHVQLGCSWVDEEAVLKLFGAS
ncbi:MAG: PHP domain-containing protein [Chlamydiia bacterium]|nr:PHP domain-containing protein [Chlamydiia bacterium]